MINWIDEQEYPYVATLSVLLRNKGYWDEFRNNYVDRHGSRIDAPTVEGRLRNEECFTATSASFHWERTPEGHAFWAGLNDKYRSLIVELKKQEILGE